MTMQTRHSLKFLSVHIIIIILLLTSWMRLRRNGTMPAAKLNDARCFGSTFCSV